MPRGLEDIYTNMTAIARSLRDIASDLDGMVDAALAGSEEDKFSSDGKIVEGRIVEDITKNGGRGSSIIKPNNKCYFNFFNT